MPRLVCHILIFLNCISVYILSTGQGGCNGAVGNKLRSLKPVLGDWQSSYKRCRMEEEDLCRVRIGHTHLTYSHILKKNPARQCDHCHWFLTVRHILVECNHFAETRTDIYGGRDVVESFRFHPH